MASTPEARPDQPPAQYTLFSPTAQSGLFQNPQKRRVICCLLLALATVVLYNPITRAPFLNYDDAVNVIDNPDIRGGVTWKTVKWAFNTPAGLDWHPITWLSDAFDYQLFGPNPAGFHSVNILIHAASAILLFLILESTTGFAWRSFFVATLFALHAINVESVAWISERKNVLSMFFFLAAIGAYGWYARRPGVARYLAVTAIYALAVMSKAQVITFPFALLLLDYWPLRRMAQANRIEGEAPLTGTGPTPAWKLILEKLPWVALSAACAFVTMHRGSAFSYTVGTEPLPLWIRLGNAAISYVRYLEKAFWPVNLAVIYPHPAFAISKPAIAASTLALLAISVLALIYHRRGALFVGWFWFLGTLVPMTGLIPIGPHSMADRYAYIPLLGIFVIVCWGAAEAVKNRRVPRTVLTAAAVTLLVALGFALHRQVSYWTNNATLWAHTIAITGPNFSAEENLALSLIDENKIDDALPHLQRARMLQPNDPLAVLNIATYDQMHGHYQAALEGFNQVVQFAGTAPSLRAMAQTNSGYAHLSLKQYDASRQDFEGALKNQPSNSSAYRGLGLVAQRAGDIALATQNYERSVELQPTAVGYVLLAQALAVTRQQEAARAAESQAARLTQNLNEDIAVARQLLAN